MGSWRCAIETASIDRVDLREDSALPFTDPRLEQVYLYWRGKAAGRAMPSRADIDPIEIPKLLPDVMLVERHEDGRYRYRLIGTENTRAHGMNATGRFLDEVLPGPDYAAHVLGVSLVIRRNFDNPAHTSIIGSLLWYAKVHIDRV